MATFLVHLTDGATFEIASIVSNTGAALTTLQAIAAALANNGNIVATDVNGIARIFNQHVVLEVLAAGTQAPVYENSTGPFVSL